MEVCRHPGLSPRPGPCGATTHHRAPLQLRSWGPGPRSRSRACGPRRPLCPSCGGKGGRFPASPLLRDSADPWAPGQGPQGAGEPPDPARQWVRGARLARDRGSFNASFDAALGPAPGGSPLLAPAGAPAAGPGGAQGHAEAPQERRPPGNDPRGCGAGAAQGSAGAGAPEWRWVVASVAQSAQWGEAFNLEALSTGHVALEEPGLFAAPLRCDAHGDNPGAGEPPLHPVPPGPLGSWQGQEGVLPGAAGQPQALGQLHLRWQRMAGLRFVMEPLVLAPSPEHLLRQVAQLCAPGAQGASPSPSAPAATFSTISEAAASPGQSETAAGTPQDRAGGAQEQPSSPGGCGAGAPIAASRQQPAHGVPGMRFLVLHESASHLQPGPGGRRWSSLEVRRALAGLLHGPAPAPGREGKGAQSTEPLTLGDSAHGAPAPAGTCGALQGESATGVDRLAEEAQETAGQGAEPQAGDGSAAGVVVGAGVRASGAMAERLEGKEHSSGSLKVPGSGLVRLAVLETSKGYLFGPVVFAPAAAPQLSFKRAPHHWSAGLPDELAAVAVTICASQGCSSVVDPCCGQGSILFQAAARWGMEAAGGDISLPTLEAAAENLTTLGFRVLRNWGPTCPVHGPHNPRKPRLPSPGLLQGPASHLGGGSTSTGALSPSAAPQGPTGNPSCPGDVGWGLDQAPVESFEGERSSHSQVCGQWAQEAEQAQKVMEGEARGPAAESESSSGTSISMTHYSVPRVPATKDDAAACEVPAEAAAAWVEGAIPPGHGPQVKLSLADAKSAEYEADCVVCNLPFGRFLRDQEKDVLGIVRNAAGRARRNLYVFVSGDSISGILEAQGYRIVSEIALKKRILVVTRWGV